MPKLEAYDRALPYSYCLGVFPCITLMESHPEWGIRLLLHPDSEGHEGVEKLRALCAAHGVREELAERVIKRESKKENCYAALVFEKREAELHGDGSHLVFCQISDGGNLGTALRAALGFGYRDIAVIRPCVDMFHPHVLRASMGAFYRLRVREYENFEAYRAAFPSHALYPFMLTGSVSLSEAARAPQSPFSLIFGNEASGLPVSFAERGTCVRIPHSDEIDSLNLSVAASIAAYAFRADARCDT